MKEELRVHSFGELISKSFTLTISSFFQYIFVIILVVAPIVFALIFLGITPFLAGDFEGLANFFKKNLVLMGSGFIAIIFAFLAYYFLAIIYISVYMSHIIANKFLGDKISMGKLITASLRPVIPAFFMFILIFIIVGISSLPIYLPSLFLSGGSAPELTSIIIVAVLTILLFFPVIYVGLGYFVSLPALIFDKEGIIKSMKKSWGLMKGKRLKILLLAITLFIVLFIFQLIMMLIFGAMANILPESLIVVFSIIYLLVSAVLGPIWICMQVLVYFNLKVEKEQYSLERLVNDFAIEHND